MVGAAVGDLCESAPLGSTFTDADELPELADGAAVLVECSLTLTSTLAGAEVVAGAGAAVEAAGSPLVLVSTLMLALPAAAESFGAAVLDE